MKHDSENEVRLNEDGVFVEHNSGTELRLEDDGVHIDEELFVDGTPMSEHTHDFDYEGGGKDSSTLSGTTEEPE